MDDTRLPLEAAAATGASAVSWAAILAGAAAAVAASLTLFALAAGLDLAAPDTLAGSDSMPVRAALALIVTQWISAALGGYLTGRLRTRWVGTHTHEVFFRDTAHGFITWCVATVFMASGLVAAASAVVGVHRHVDGVAPYARRAGEVSASGARVTTEEPTRAIVSLAAVPPAYGELVLPDGPGSAVAVETRRAALAQLTPDDWPPDDWRDRRVRELRAAPADPGDVPRTAAVGSLLTALSMVIGAFIASVSAVLGGRHRDLHP
jgi:hypothetical protein